MKKLSLLLLSLALLAVASCSRSDKKETTTAQPQSTPDAERLKSDSERLQQATNKAAEQRRKDEEQKLSARSPGPKADLSPHTVPPQSPNPNP